MNILNDLHCLSKDLKDQFNNKIPKIQNKKIVHGKVEYVLETDILSQNRLSDIAKKYHPNSKLISEELNNYHDIESQTGSMIVIDPLDGTHNFFFGLPMWGFSYTVFSESKVAIESYIGLPMLDILIGYSKEKITVYRSGECISPKDKKIPISSKPLSEMMVAYDNQFKINPKVIKDNFNLLVENVFTVRISGAAVFDIAMIITGKLDARIWHSTEIYDVAPAFAFFGKSGGVINLDTGKNAVIQDKALIATNNRKIYMHLQDIGFTRVK